MTPSGSDEIGLRQRKNAIFHALCWSATWSGLAALLTLLISVVFMAWGWLDWQFLTSYDSRLPAQAGVLAGLLGSLWLIGLTIVFSVPVGIGAALYLEEYAEPTKFTRLIQINLNNLAGVPSLVYGMLGLTVFVRFFGMTPMEHSSGIVFPFGRTVISGALTLAMLVLPVVIIAAQEALRAVPPSIRHASYALGATHWQTIWHQVLPAAFPGMLTGIILSISRAMGETAPLIVIGALTYVPFAPGGIDSLSQAWENPAGLIKAPFDAFTALPIQIFNWISGRTIPEFQHVAAAGILVLLFVLLVLNSVAAVMRHRARQTTRW